jgi:tellurite resistance protein TerC
MGTLALWVVFNIFVLLLLALDLGVFHRHSRVISLREAAWWSAIWVLVALAFNAGMLLWYPAEATAAVRQARALEFFFGYLIERALSVDNIFVFLVLFNYFGVESRHQYRVLFWGILGALVMRGAMIGAGVALIAKFHWLLYVFGAFLVWTGAKMLVHKPEDVHPEHNPVLRWARKFLPVTHDYEGEHFFVRRPGGSGQRGSAWLATPLFLVLLVVETTDLAFALDSIPAIFGITRDAFIIYSSNVFAILGLRALYFLLAGVLPYFHYLSAGLSVVLMFIGVKMLVEPWWKIPILASLGIVIGVLALAVLASLVVAMRKARVAARMPVPAPANPTEIKGLVAELASEASGEREAAATALYEIGSAMGEAATDAWWQDEELRALLDKHATVGIAVGPERFEAIRAQMGEPRLSDVPPDQDAIEFEVHFGRRVRLDILTTRAPGGEGPIAKFLGKFGEGIQQVEFSTSDVDRATARIGQRFGVKPVYPATRPGADATRVNFFLLATPEGKKVLVELVEMPGGNAASGVPT